jgi:hypothetical protein
LCDHPSLVRVMKIRAQYIPVPFNATKMFITIWISLKAKGFSNQVKIYNYGSFIGKVVNRDFRQKNYKNRVF